MRLSLFLSMSIMALSLANTNVEKAKTAVKETAQEKGLRIFQEADKFNEGFLGEESKMEMILLNASGEKIERKMISKIKEEKEDGDKSIIEFLWPADVKGTRMLTWTHKSDDDDQWLYLPSLRKVKRISSRNKSGSFMGSEFSYEDLGSQEVEKFTYQWIKDEEIEGKKVWVIERKPVGKKSGYSKQIVWMDQKIKNAVRIQYFDRKGDLLKTAQFKKYVKKKDWWRVGEIEILNHQTSKKSILTWSDRVVGKKFNKRDFNKKKLIK